MAEQLARCTAARGCSCTCSCRKLCVGRDSNVRYECDERSVMPRGKRCRKDWAVGQPAGADNKICVNNEQLAPQGAREQQGRRARPILYRCHTFRMSLRCASCSVSSATFALPRR